MEDDEIFEEGDPEFPDFSYAGINLVRTCYACPEQYYAFDDAGKMVGYFRLRHGHFSVDYPDCGGKTVYEAEPRCDGMFELDEREGFLIAGIEALKKEMGEEAMPAMRDFEYREQDAEFPAEEMYCVVFFPRVSGMPTAVSPYMLQSTAASTPEKAKMLFVGGLGGDAGWDEYAEAGWKVRKVRVIDLGDA